MAKAEKKKKEPETKSAVATAEPIKAPRPVSSKHDVLFVGFRSLPAMDAADWMPELKLGNVKDPDKIAKAVEEKTAKFNSECSRYPFTGELAEVSLQHINMRTHEVTTRLFNRNSGEGSAALQAWTAIRDMHPQQSWPADRFSDFPAEGGLLIIGFDAKDFVRILASQVTSEKLMSSTDSPVPLRFWRENDLCLDPYDEIVSGEAQTYASLSMVLSRAGLSWAGKADGKPYVSHLSPDVDSTMAIELAVRFNLLPKKPME